MFLFPFSLLWFLEEPCSGFFQVFRPEEGKGRSVGCREVEGAFGFYGGGYGRVVVGRNVGVEQHPAGGGGGGGSGGRLRHAYPLGVAKRLPVISQVRRGG